MVKQSLTKERKTDKTAALRSPRWIPFDQSRDSMDINEEALLGMPPSMRTKLSAYILHAASASTIDEGLESLATVRTCELGMPPVCERQRKQDKTEEDVEFVDYELGEQTAESSVEKDQKQVRDEGNLQDSADPATVVLERGVRPDEAEDQLREGATEDLDLQIETIDEFQNEGGDIAIADEADDKVNEVTVIEDKGQGDESTGGNHKAIEEAAINEAEASVMAEAMPVEYSGGDRETVSDDVVPDANQNEVLGLNVVVSSGDDIFPPSPPHEILINKNTSVRSNLKDYHTEIEVLDQLIEKYSHSVTSPVVAAGTVAKPPTDSEDGETPPPTVPTVDLAGDGSDNPVDTSAPPCDESPLEETQDNHLVDHADSVPEEAWSILPNMQELVDKFCGNLSTMAAAICVSENRFWERGQETERMSEDSSEFSHADLQQSVASRIDVGETQFIPVVEHLGDESQAQFHIDAKKEADRAKGKSRRLFAVRKTFMKVFNREQKKLKKQVQEEETRDPKTALAIHRRPKQKRGAKLWPWRGGQSKVHKPKFVDSAFE